MELACDFNQDESFESFEELFNGPNPRRPDLAKFWMKYEPFFQDWNFMAES